nr:CRTAC1 family protein [Sphingopyxis lutea]
MFAPVVDAIPFEAHRRQKWDSPVVVDLDQDGRSDLIVTEHGKSLIVYWNEGRGRFSRAQQLAGGDLHGLAAADFDRDGVMDLVVAQGGGDGANPRRPLHLRIARDRTVVSRGTFDYFEKGRGRAVNFLDVGNDGLLDLVVTGFPTPDQPEGANHLYRYVTEEKLVFGGVLPQAKWLGYRTALTDFDGDGVADILLFGGENMVALKGAADGSFADASTAVLGGLANTSDVAGVAQIDFDNDGDLDLFLARAEHQFDLESYYDPASRTFAFLTFRKPFRHEFQNVTGDLVIENLQRSYPHYDVYLGKEKRKLADVPDRHAGRDLTIAASAAEGWPEGPTEEGLYIGHLGNGVWRIAGQVQSRLAAAIRGVDIAAPIEPQRALPARLFENRNGRFVDVSEAMGIDIDEQTTSVAAGDFDNDGWSDLAILRYGDMSRPTSHIVLLNRGGKHFERVDGHGVMVPDIGTTGGAVEIFDYDNDGALDLIVSSERGRWQLLHNRAADRRNFAGARVGYSPTGQAQAPGAVLTATACGRTYQRVVGAGSGAFSQSFNQDLHLGLGDCTAIGKAEVRWTNGETVPVTLRRGAYVNVGDGK